MIYDRHRHAAARTDDFVFRQLIPYIGNKRKLLPLISEALEAAGCSPRSSTFLDLFAGTGVVSRYAKALGYRVVANDWEPYADVLNRSAIACNVAPATPRGRCYHDLIAELDTLPGTDDWVTNYLCPVNDEAPDPSCERMFYMRKTGRRIDAIRTRIAEWDAAGDLSDDLRAALLAPLLFAACYHANTSGVFKGFHRGWGGQTGTALYRIAADLRLNPAQFFDNDQNNLALRRDAAEVGDELHSAGIRPDIVYVDPPYNQHPYASNYHVLNSITLWDKPSLTRRIDGPGTKAAIRTDWRDTRRSAYNHKAHASDAYRALIESTNSPWIATSYSTDGTIPLEALVSANREIGDVQVFMQSYKRYRVSSQRFSKKPLNVEFVLLTRVGARPLRSADEIVADIRRLETSALVDHPETDEPPGTRSLQTAR